MTVRNAMLALVALLLLIALPGVSVAQAPAERFAGEARLGAQPPLPLHVELRRQDGAVAGTVSIPFGAFALVDATGGTEITGGFSGPGGRGAIILRVEGDALTGEFDLGGQKGTLSARRTDVDAKTLFRPKEARLDLSTERWLEDLDRLADILTREHAAPFHRISEADLSRELSRIRAAIPALDGARVALELRKLGAMIGDGHTGVDLPPAKARLPLEFFVFADGPRVVDASAGHQDLIGARLIAIGDVPAAEVSDRLRALIPQGETPNFHRAALPGLLVNPDALASVGLGRAFTFEAGGTQRSVEFEPMATVDYVPARNDRPLWKRSGDKPFWTEWLSGDVLYVNWRAYHDLPKNAAALLAEIDAKRPKKLVVDLRDNSGGDFEAGRALVDALANRDWLNRRGALFVLIGRNTFSAAMTNAVDLKLKTNAILVGEPAGAAPNNWQEIRRFTLPNSSLRVGVSTRFYEFLPGKTELAPEHVVPPSPGDWTDAQDGAVRFGVEWTGP